MNLLKKIEHLYKNGTVQHAGYVGVNSDIMLLSAKGKGGGFLVIFIHPNDVVEVRRSRFNGKLIFQG